MFFFIWLSAAECVSDSIAVSLAAIVVVVVTGRIVWVWGS